MFLNELVVSQESGQLKNTSGSSEGNGSESAELLRLLRLHDVRRKMCYNLLAPSVKERNQWYKCLEQACSEFLENEKCHLQRQQSSKFAVNNLVLVCKLSPAPSTVITCLCSDAVFLWVMFTRILFVMLKNRQEATD